MNYRHTLFVLTSLALAAPVVHADTADCVAQDYTTPNAASALNQCKVPTGVTSITVTACGASSGQSGPAPNFKHRGKGAQVSRTLAVNAGDILGIAVGGVGGDGTDGGFGGIGGAAGINGGGAGGSSVTNGVGGGAGGGGWSGVFLNLGTASVTLPATAANIVVIAGAGAGPGGSAQSSDGPDAQGIALNTNGTGGNGSTGGGGGGGGFNGGTGGIGGANTGNGGSSTVDGNTQIAGTATNCANAGSGKVTLSNFVTATPAALSAVNVSSTYTGTVSNVLTGTSNGAGKGYYVAVASGSPAPSAQQVKSGQDSNNAAGAAFGNDDMVAGVLKSFTLTGLVSNTAYDVYLTVDNTKVLATPSKVSLTTLNVVKNVMFSVDKGTLSTAKDTEIDTSNATGIPSGTTFPTGFSTFNVSGLNAAGGDVVTVTLTLPAGSTANGIVKVDNNSVYSVVPSTAGTSASGLPTLTYTITDTTDGTKGDTNVAAGTITDPVAAAVVPGAGGAASGAAAGGGGGGGGGALGALLLLPLGAMAIYRRRRSRLSR